MKDKILIALAVMLLLGCNASQDAKNYSDSLIVVSGAQNIRYAKFNGTDQLLYEIKIQYPANAVLEELRKQLEIKGWSPLSEDYLNPGLPSSHIRGWSDFIDATKSPERKVHQWLAQWEDKKGDILWCTLRYSYPCKGTPNLKDLTVSEVFIPAAIAREAKEATEKYTQTHKRN
jgi:hypothetical protein